MKNMGLLIIIAWIFAVAIFISAGIMSTNVLAAIIGIVLLIVPFIYSGANQIKTPQGRKAIKKHYEREKKIEKEYGIIDWEDK